MSTRQIETSSRPATKKSFAGRGRPPDSSKREAIVVAAAEAFFEHGFAGSSIEQIAAVAGVSKVTVYNHFGDKNALFAAAVECECEKMRGHFSIDAQLAELGIRDRLTAIGEAIVAFLSRPEMVQFERRIAAETERDPAIGAAFLKAGPWRMKLAFSAFLAFADERGELCIPDPMLAAEQFVSMCKGMGDLERRFGAIPAPQDDTRRIAGAVDLFLKAYAPDKAASAGSTHNL